MKPKKIIVPLATTLSSLVLFSFALPLVPFEAAACLASKQAAAIAGILGLGMALGTLLDALKLSPDRKAFKALSAIGCIAVGLSLAALLAGFTGYGYEMALAADLIAFCCVSIKELNR